MCRACVCPDGAGSDCGHSCTFTCVRVCWRGSVCGVGLLSIWTHLHPCVNLWRPDLTQPAIQNPKPPPPPSHTRSLPAGCDLRDHQPHHCARRPAALLLLNHLGAVRGAQYILHYCILFYVLFLGFLYVDAGISERFRGFIQGILSLFSRFSVTAQGGFGEEVGGRDCLCRGCVRGVGCQMGGRCRRR